MADTTFIPRLTNIVSTWLNQINRYVFGGATAANLRTLDSTIYTRFRTLGYYTPGDGGGGDYYLDPADTTSADNGGTVFVAADGGRWKLIHNGSVYFRQFGLIGDADGTPGHGTDNLARMQVMFDWAAGQTSTVVGQAGAELLIGDGYFRITGTAYYGTGTRIRGNYAGGYPYVNTALTKTSGIVCDFGSNVNQWGLDSRTFHSVAGGGGPILYNEWVTDQLGGTGSGGFTATYGAELSGFILIDANNALQTQIPYGSIRANGCPNIKLENVSVLGFGLAPTFGSCPGYLMLHVTSVTNYYGPVCYNANNQLRILGCQFDKTQAPASVAVPNGVIPSWMPSAVNFGSVYNLDASHHGNSKGLIITADPSINSNEAVIDCIAQYWDDTCYLVNSYGNSILSLYAEQTQKFVLTTAYASFNIVNAHNFSGASPLPYFSDIGYNSIGRINVGGNNTCFAFWKNAWASLSAADATRVSVGSVSGTGGVLPINQRVTMEFEEAAWTPGITSSGGALGSVVVNNALITRLRDTIRVDLSFTTTIGTATGNFNITGLPYPTRTVQAYSCLTVGKTGYALTAAGSTTFQIFNADGTNVPASATYQLSFTYIA